MALYAFVCEDGHEDDRFCSYEEAKDQVCQCGLPMKKLLSSLEPVGPTDTKPEILGGKRLVTSSQVSKWENDNPGLKVMSRSDSTIKDKIIRMRHAADRKAKKAGYNSERHRQAEVKERMRVEGNG